MKLHEYQAKKILSQYDLPIPQIGYICTSSTSIDKVVRRIAPPWVAKCQVHAGGRGKAGGVKIIQNKKKLNNFINYWIGKRLVTCQTNETGLPVNSILIEAITKIKQEIYLSIVIDWSSGNILFLASVEGGINIEQPLVKTQYLIHKVIINPRRPQLFQGRILALKLGLSEKVVAKFFKCFLVLLKLFITHDLLLAEINPLAITKTGQLICLDAKLKVDKNAFFRQQKLWRMKDPSQEELLKVDDQKCCLNYYVSLPGNIGCMVNGADSALATMDIIQLSGGKTANFLDVGGVINYSRDSQKIF